MQSQSQSAPNVPDPNLIRIIFQNIVLFVLGVIIFGAVLFFLAGSFNYWQAWIFIVVFNLGLVTQTMYLAIKDPALLERRKNLAPAEESTKQKILLFMGLGSLFGLIVFSGLDYRFGWSQMPPIISLIGNGLIVLSFIVYIIVFKENSFAATSVQTFENQTVISTGLYAVVRHPKYVGDLLLILGMILALGSWWALIFLVITLLALAWRIIDEEKLLKNDLPGYTEYTQQVKYRLIPYVW